MTTLTKSTPWLLCALLVAASTDVGWAAPPARKPAAAQATRRGALAVVVSPENPISEVSLSTLKAIFTRQMPKWPGGEEIQVFNWDPGHPVRVAFDRAVLRMSPTQASDFWIDQRLRGRGSPPRSMSAAALIPHVVARLKWSVGYLPVEAVTPGIKVLRVEGRKPQDPGYPIVLQSK